jgi:diacylglycerol kinase (ATP)
VRIGTPDILIVANPVSGRGRGRRMAEAVAEDLHDRGLGVSIRYTSAPGDAEAMAADPLNDASVPPRCIVACGGDGTVQGVANALASSRAGAAGGRPSMAIAPAGRCNDFARALGISRDAGRVAATIAEGCATPIDLGYVNGRYFCTVATIGIDAEVSAYVDTTTMPLRGTAAYLFAAFRVLGGYRPRELRIAGEFGVIDRPVFLASSANTACYGGAIPIAPGASPADGLLDLCVIDAVSLARALRLIPRVLIGHHPGQAEVRIERTRRLEIDADERLEIWADGERVGRTPATVAVAPGAVNVLLPRGFDATEAARRNGRWGGPG